jgi:HK97 family phage portal protein
MSKFLDAVKAIIRWPGAGGGTSPSGWSWLDRGGTFPGSAYNYNEAAGPLHLNPVVMACVGWYQQAITTATLEVAKLETSTGEENPVPDHPLTAFLQSPNPFHTGSMLLRNTLPDLLTNGNAYWLKIRNGSGQPIEVWNVPCGRIRPQWNTSGREYIGSYLLSVEGNDQTVPVKDVVHFRLGTDPQNDRLGWAPIRSALREVAILNAGANFQGALLRNGCVPTHLLSPKPGTPPFTGDQVKGLMAMWNSACGGDKVGKAVASSLPMDAVRVGFSMGELDIGPMTWMACDTVCSNFGLSAMVLNLSSGSEHKTYANGVEAATAAWRTGGQPFLSLIAGTIRLQLLADFGDPVRECARWDYSAVDILQEDENALAERLQAGVEKGIISRNEARAEVGLPPVGDGPMRKAFDTPQPLTAQGFPWDPLPEWAPEPVMPALPPGAPPESSGDAQAQAEQPAPATGPPTKAECDYCYVKQASPWVPAWKANLCDECCRRVAPEEFAARKALALPEAVRITRAHVAEAEVLWDELMPEAEGLLSAKPSNGKH